MRSNNKRDAILDAAFQVVEDEGANHLTIDAVAAKAGLSKGGVLYHFASKKALLSAMLEYLIEANNNRVKKHARNERSFSALLHVTDRMTAQERRASLALIAAAAEDPELLEPARNYISKTIEALNTNTDDEVGAMILFLANEGLRFLDILELNPMNDAQSRRVIERLSKQAEEI